MKTKNQIKVLAYIFVFFLTVPVIICIYNGIHVGFAKYFNFGFIFKNLCYSVLAFASVIYALNKVYKTDIIEILENKENYIRLDDELPKEIKKTLSYLCWKPLEYIDDLYSAKIIYKIENEEQRKQKNKELIESYRNDVIDSINRGINKFIQNSENKPD